MDTSYWKALSPAAKKSTHPCYLWIASQPTVLLQIHGDKNTSLKHFCYCKIGSVSSEKFSCFQWLSIHLCPKISDQLGIFQRPQTGGVFSPDTPGNTNQSGVAQWIWTSLWGLCAAPVLIKESVENSPPPGVKSSLEKIWPTPHPAADYFQHIFPFYTLPPRFFDVVEPWSAQNASQFEKGHEKNLGWSLTFLGITY